MGKGGRKDSKREEVGREVVEGVGEGGELGRVGNGAKEGALHE